MGQRSNLPLGFYGSRFGTGANGKCGKNERLGLIRIMPNTPVAIGQGVISLSRSQAVTDQQLAQVKQLLAGAGALRNRRKFDGSCNGYRRLWSSLCLSDDRSHGGCRGSHGISTKQASSDGGQTFKGAASMVLETGQHPGSLKDAVCSPGGSNHRRSQSLRTSRPTGRHYCRWKLPTNARKKWDKRQGEIR